MQRLPRPLTTLLAAATLLSSLAFNAHAHAPAGEHQHSPKVTHSERQQQRMEKLKTILQIQPQQHAAWEQYRKAMTPQPPAAKAPRSDKALTTPERLDRAQQLRQARMEQAQQRDQATRSFYSSLSPSQQQAFDALHTQRHPKKHGMHKGAAHGKHHGAHRSPAAAQ